MQSYNFRSCLLLKVIWVSLKGMFEEQWAFY